MSSNLAEKSSCLFCNIVNKLEETQILYEDEEICIFNDIKPASRFHILTVPKRHIEDARTLTSADKELVTRMLTVAKEYLQKQNLSIEDARFGFHWPPFRSIHHLHLHAIAPESEMGMIGKAVFMKNSYWFVSEQYHSLTVKENIVRKPECLSYSHTSALEIANPRCSRLVIKPILSLRGLFATVGRI